MTDEPEDVDRVVDVEDVMAIEPLGSKGDEVGRDPSLDDELGRFDHGDHPVVGTCELCGREIHEGIVGHVCEDGFRHHRDGEQIAPVDEPKLVCDGGEPIEDATSQSDVPDYQTALEEGVVIEVGEGTPEQLEKAFEGFPGHSRRTWAHIDLVLPTAELERLMLELEETEHESVVSLIRVLTSIGLRRFFEQGTAEQVNVEVPEETWKRIRLEAAAGYQRGEDPERAFQDRMVETLPAYHNYLLEGSPPDEDPLTPGDLPIIRDEDDEE